MTRLMKQAIERLKSVPEDRQDQVAGLVLNQISGADLSPSDRAKALQSLFDQWAAEDATDDPQELARREAEWGELRRALNENRTSGRKLFS